MDIERTTDCMFDRLIIYDGRNKKSPILATLCGGGQNIVLNATGNYHSLLNFNVHHRCDCGLYSCNYKTCFDIEMSIHLRGNRCPKKTHCLSF